MSKAQGKFDFSVHHPFKTSLPWPHGTVKCPWKRTFCILFYEYCEFGCTTLFTKCFSPTRV